MTTNPQQIADLLNRYRFDPNKPVKEDIVVLTIEGRKVGTLGNYIAIAGKPKTGKSLFLSGMLSSAYLPDAVWQMKLIPPPGRRKIVVIDTEQSRFAFKRMLDRVKKLIGLDNFPNFIQVYAMRGAGPANVKQVMEAVLQDPEVFALMVDGLLDCVKNFNSEEEASEFTQFLMRLSSERDVLIIGNIHMGKKDNYTLGHLGSAVDRNAESVLKIEKDDSKKFVTMSAEFMRNDFEFFNPITLEYNGQDFQQTTIDIKSKKEQHKGFRPLDYTEQQHRYKITAIVPSAGVIYDTLVQEVSENYGISKIKAKEFIRYWLEKNWIIKSSDGSYKAVSSGLFGLTATA